MRPVRDGTACRSDPQALLATMPPRGVAKGLPDKPWLHENHHNITSATVGVAEQTAQMLPQFFHTPQMHGGLKG